MIKSVHKIISRNRSRKSNVNKQKILVSIIQYFLIEFVLEVKSSLSIREISKYKYVSDCQWIKKLTSKQSV